jgi:hypothetical protein
MRQNLTNDNRQLKLNKRIFIKKVLFTNNNRIFAPLIEKTLCGFLKLREKVVKNSGIPINIINNSQ